MNMQANILTAAGDYFDLLHPEEFDYDVAVIGHALSNLGRFTGHTVQFYSVAQHSVLVSRALPPELALQGLLHDAAEAFLGDVAAPLKAHLPNYREIEARVQLAINRHFGLPDELDPRVKEADMVLLATEKRDLMPRNNGDAWACLRGVPMLQQQIVPVGPEDARSMFAARWSQLQRASWWAPLRLVGA